jgi:two-component system, NtrC family, sensor kinase
MDGHGKLTVRTAALGDDRIMVEIGDTGPGVPDEVRTRVFEPFFTTKDVGRGTGQGLALARAVVQEQHGGSIAVHSRVGVGTTITILLPVQQPPDSQGSTA